MLTYIALYFTTLNYKTKDFLQHSDFEIEVIYILSRRYYWPPSLVME